MPLGNIEYRVATSADVAAMARSRLADPSGAAMDPRVAAYLDGEHHPREALPPRIGYLALDAEAVVGYIAGHRTRRFGYDGELQYLFVAPGRRRAGIATALVGLLARWFLDRGIARVCVNVDTGSPGAAPFYRSVGAGPLNPHWYAWEDIGTALRGRAPPPPGDRER